MGLSDIFRSKPKCTKFFTYKTSTLNLDALSAGMSKTELAEFKFSLGKLHIEPDYVKVSERLMELDQQQYALCETIANISDRKERDKLFAEHARLRMEMMREAAKVSSKPDQTKESPSKPPAMNEIFNLLDEGRIVEVLERCDKIEFTGADKMIYNRKKETYIAGLEGQRLLDWQREMKVLVGKYA